MINLIDAILMNEISNEKATDILDETIDKFHSGELHTLPQEELGLDKFEWTAIGFGIDLVLLAKWRQQGWPKTCMHCGKKIDYKVFGWRIVKDDFICIKCS